MIRFLLLNVSSPFKLGVYEHDSKLDTYEKDGKASDVLPIIIDEALARFEPSEIYYTSGPGNHMSLKIAYVCVKSLAITKDIPLYGLNPFDFNGGFPIRAMSHNYFVYEQGKITLTKIEDNIEEKQFLLPERFDFEAVRIDEEPLFLLPAV